jgi:hypothetical protein
VSSKIFATQLEFYNRKFSLLVLLASPVPEAKDARWSLVPDAAGRMHLIDLDPFETPIEPFFNAAVDVRFLLYTRTNPTAGQRIILEDINSLRNSNYNANHETRFTVHGWVGTLESSVNRNVNREYLRLGNYNVS